jgi:hypothetical protein
MTQILYTRMNKKKSLAERQRLSSVIEAQRVANI